MKQLYALLILLLGLIPFLPAQSLPEAEKNHKPESKRLPDLFGYQDHDTRILKINLLDLVQFNTPKGLVGKLQLAYEQKLKPAWSLNTELSANYFFSAKQSTNPSMQLQDGILTLTLEPRYYLDLKRRIFFKQSRNNFSANYVSLAFSTRLLELNRGFSATDNARYLYSDNFGIAPVFGIQRRIFKWIFLDFHLGLRLSYGDPVRTQLFFPKDSDNVWQIVPHTMLRLGIAI